MREPVPSSDPIGSAGESAAGWTTRAPVWLILAVAWPVFIGLTVPLAALERVGGDEGVELAKALHWRRMGGFDPSIWNDQPLTHTRWFATLLDWHPGPLLPRLWSLLHFGLLLIGAGCVTRRLGGPPAAAAAAVLTVALSPTCLDLALSAMQEMPMTAWGIAAFALALEYRRHPRAAWLIASAAAASFATSIKLTGGLFAGSAALLLFFGGIERRTISRRPRLLIPSLYLAGVGALSWIALAWIDGRTPADWLGSHWIALRSAPSGWAERLSELANGLTTHAWPVILLAGLAALSGSDWGSEPSRARVAFVALVLPVATFHLIIRPWWGFYAVSAVAVLAPAAGIAVAHAWSALGKGGLIERVRWKWPSQATTIRFSVVLVALGAAGMGWIERWNLWRAAPRTGESPVVRAIREFESDGPAGCLYAADAMDAFWTGVPVPPELLVVTEKRFLSGSLPQDGVPRALARAGCDFIVLPDGSAATRGPAWDSLLARDYVRVAVGGGKELFVHRELDPSPHESRLRW